MSKKMNKLVLLSALMIVIIGTIVSASEVNPTTTDLIADGGSATTEVTVGNVSVWNDESNLYVTYRTIDGWLLNETHLHIAKYATLEEAGDTPEEAIPQTKKGNPKVGQFDYSEEHEPCVDGYTYEIPLNGLSGEVYIAAHAAVDGTTTYESAWGEGDEFNEGRNWAMYFTYAIEPTIEDPEQENQ